MKRTKIVCTIGPASSAPDRIEAMIRAGMNVARLNFSHGSHEEHAAKVATIRSIAKALGRPVAILQDLAGPKIRVGEIPEGPIQLLPDAEFMLTNRPVAGNAREVSITYADLPNDVQPGDTLLLSDGALELRVARTDGHDIACRVVVGGPLSSHKGINLPSRSIRAPILSEKDHQDLLFGIEQGVDFVAVSFVRSVEDIRAVRAVMREKGVDIPIIAKIEKHEALDRIDDILAEASGLMVARGDLSVEIPMERVPLIQKDLIRRANRAGKPVITATQMLLSMVNNPRPTRAEVNDVANAVLDGTDAIMLSEESAMGRYPAEAVATMTRVAHDAEQGLHERRWDNHESVTTAMDRSEAVGDAACELAWDIRAAAIVPCTMTGGTARLIAKYRPHCLIVAATPSETAWRRMALDWGVEPVLVGHMEGADSTIRQAKDAARQCGLLKPGDTIVITAGVPIGAPGTTNLVMVDAV